MDGWMDGWTSSSVNCSPIPSHSDSFLLPKKRKHFVGVEMDSRNCTFPKRNRKFLKKAIYISRFIYPKAFYLKLSMLVNNNDNANPIANSIANTQLQLVPMLAADIRLILAYNAQLLVDQIFAQQLRSAQTAKGSSQLLLAQQQPPNENLAKPGPEHGGWVHDGLPKSKSAAEEMIPDPPASFPASPASSSSSSADGSVQCQSPASSSSAWHCQWLHCSRRLPSQQLLLDHLRTDHLMLVHVGQADVVCQWRGCQRRQKPFGAIYMLQQHLRAHTGEKPYQCHWQNCAKRYSRLENLKTHLRKHTGERPYTCPVCSAGFTNASDRAKHVDRVHGHQKRYHCPQPGCPSAYTDPSSLRKHIYSQHGKQEWTSYKQAKQLTGNNKSGLIR